MSRRTKILFAVGCVLLTQCLDNGFTGPSRIARVLDGLANDVALQQYDAFVVETKAMAEAAAAFCASPDAAGLEGMRTAWLSAKTPWKRAEVVLFGPVVEYPLRLGPKLDDWPVNSTSVEALVTGDSALDQDAFDGKGTARRGLPVVEYLLWSNQNGTEPLAALTNDSRRCEVLVGVSADVATNAMRLRDAWRDEWSPQVTTPESVEDGAYDSSQEVLDEWVNRMAFTVENIRVIKLGKPAGDGANGQIQPDIIESRLSGRSLSDARDALQGVYWVWTGGGDDGQLGVRDLLQGAGVVQQMEFLFQTAMEELAALPDTLEETLMANPESVVPAKTALTALQSVIQGEVATSVGVTLKFNDADGD